MSNLIRNATIEDVDGLYQLIAHYAEKGIMLPRSKEALTKQIETFMVAEVDGKLVGCGSLFKLGDDLVEIRSLGVLDTFKGKGLGRLLSEALMDKAQQQGFSKVMALTYEVAFFERLGFEVVQKEIFPEKVWTDCIHCSKQDHCDEIAVIKRLS